MRKSNMFKKILVGGLMAVTLAATATAMAAPQKEVYDFNEGSRIVHLEGERSEVLLETRKEMWAGLEAGRSVSYLMEMDLDDNTANASVVIAPQDEEEIYLEKTIVVRGNLNEVESFNAMKLAKGWGIDFHEEWGTILEPYAETIISKDIK